MKKLVFYFVVTLFISKKSFTQKLFVDTQTKPTIVYFNTLLKLEESNKEVNKSNLPNKKLVKTHHKTIEEANEWSIERQQFEYDLFKEPKTGLIPKDAASLALDAAMRSKEFKTIGPALNSTNAVSLNVVPRGPNNLGGRTRSIGIDKRNSQIMLAGGVSSGIFRTTNGGTSWVKVTPANSLHSVTSIAQDPRIGFENTWYYGTGESSGNSASLTGSSFYMGHGIWKSTDNGLTWSALTATQSILQSFNSPFDFIHRLVVDPTNGNVYAAACNTIQRSTDGGTSWSTIIGSFANANYTDVIITPLGRVYIAFDGNEANNGVWTSTTGASGSYTRIAGTGAATSPATWNAQAAYGRVVLAYAPSDTNTVFALYYNNFNSNCTTPGVEAEFFRWNQSTSTWTDLSANLPNEAGCLTGNDPFAVQGGYDLVVAVKPNDVNVVFVGGTNLYRSTNGFTSTAATTRIGGYASAANYALFANHHPDIHFLTFANGDNNTLYCGDDGGIQKANITAGVVWTPLNNDYVTYQYYHVDINPSTINSAFAGGAQDNGTTICSSGTTHVPEWGGDGCQTQLIKYNSSSDYNIIVSSQAGSIYNNTQSVANNIKPSTAGNGIFVTYFHLDQDNTNHLYYVSSDILYRTRIASTIASTAVTSNASTGWENVTGVASTLSSSIRCIATSRDNTYSNADYTASNTNRVLYMGTESGLVYRLNDPAFGAVATAPVAITPAGSSGIVSSIAVNPYNDNEIMVTYANYGVNSVYWTNNAKTAAPTWVNIEGPSTGPVALGSARSCIIAKMGTTLTYFVGNSTGLFSTQALSGATTVWDRVGVNSIKFALCASMRLRVNDNKIALGTHGNGMFELQLNTIYRFTGNGNFTLASNWENSILPPDTLSAAASIIIAPSAGGKCILNKQLVILNGASINVVVNAKLENPGNLVFKN